MKMKIILILALLCLTGNVCANAGESLWDMVQQWSDGKITDFELLGFIRVWSTGIMQAFDSMPDCDGLQNSIIDKLHQKKPLEAEALYDRSYDRQCRQKANYLIVQLRPHRDAALGVYDYYEDMWDEFNWTIEDLED